jgi:hypothetical protein
MPADTEAKMFVSWKPGDVPACRVHGDIGEQPVTGLNAATGLMLRHLLAEHEPSPRGMW